MDAGTATGIRAPPIWPRNLSRTQGVIFDAFKERVFRMENHGRYSTLAVGIRSAPSQLGLACFWVPSVRGRFQTDAPRLAFQGVRAAAEYRGSGVRPGSTRPITASDEWHPTDSKPQVQAPDRWHLSIFVELEKQLRSRRLALKNPSLARLFSG